MAHLVTGRVFVLRSVRVFYEKFGSMKFISHLDMNRFMIRMVRVSKIPVWYSEGFNPHPYITFALPLSLGFDSSYEVMDIRLDDDTYSNEEVFNSLSSVMPPDIKIFKVSNPVMKAGDIVSAEFVITFDEIDKNLTEKFNDFLAADKEILVEKKSKKGKLNTIDISHMIYSYKLQDNELKLNLAAGGSDNLNPKLLLEAFSKEYNTTLPNYSIKRIMIYTKENKQFV